MPAPATLPPPQVSGSARSASCATPAPDVPKEVNVKPEGLSPVQTQAMEYSVEAIFNAKAFVDHVTGMAQSKRAKAWNTGPFGQDDLAARVYLGSVNDDTLAVVGAALGNMAAVLAARQPLVVRSGSRYAYEADGKVLTMAKPVTPSMGAKAILTALAATSGMRRSAKLVDFIFARQGAAGDCLLSKEQV